VGGLPSSLPQIARWQTVLSDVEGFDLGKLLSQPRTSISTPAELNGFVEKSGTIVRASVNWPNRVLRGGAVVPTPFETGTLADDTLAALSIAASIAWAQAAGARCETGSLPAN
jgi:hypothetical protein